MPRKILSSLRRFAALLRYLDWPQRSMFARLQIRRLIGLRRNLLPQRFGRPIRVLVVCHANIRRSPYAAALLRRIAASHSAMPNWSIESAGVMARPGRSADPRVVAAATPRGVSLEGHLSRLVMNWMVEEADLILVMDWMNEVVLLDRYPGAENKVVMLGSFGRGSSEPLEIEDPIMSSPSDIAACLERIDRAVQALWAEIGSDRNGNS